MSNEMYTGTRWQVAVYGKTKISFCDADNYYVPTYLFYYVLK